MAWPFNNDVAIWVPIALIPDEIYLNRTYLDSYTPEEIQSVTTHELGHALGLEHSYSGNVMSTEESGMTTLGGQDVADYRYLWGN